MRAVTFTSIQSVRTVNTKNGQRVIAEVEIFNESKQEFWMSVKQGDKLSKCFDELIKNKGYSSKRAECHAVLDAGNNGERFVWCGMHKPSFSELKFLEEKFGVKCESPYIGRYDIGNDATSEPNENLKDD